MKQTEIIAQLRSLRESQAEFAKTNGDEIFKRDEVLYWMPLPKKPEEEE